MLEGAAHSWADRKPERLMKLAHEPSSVQPELVDVGYWADMMPTGMNL